MPRGLPWRIGAALLPAALGVLGFLNGPSDWRSATTAGQYLAAGGVVLHGPLGVAAALAVVAGHAWGRPLLTAWAVVVTFVAGVAPVAWGDAPAMIGVLSAFSAAMLVAAVLWAAMQGVPAPPNGPAA